MKPNRPNLIRGIQMLFLVGIVSFFAGCSEEIDDSNYAIKDKPTLTELITGNDSLSYIKAILEEVRLSSSDRASSLSSVLSARGNYTVFAPTNEAVEAYCEKITGSKDVSQLTYEQKQLIAYSCIIDCGRANAYESAEFPVNGSFLNTNLNDRLISCTINDNSEYIINGTSPVITADFEATNGYLHLVSTVIAPSGNNVAELIQSADNLKIFGKLLEITGIQDTLAVEKDMDYENDETLPETRYWSSVAYTGSNRNWDIPRHRYLGFTGFVETDDVFEQEWGITAPQVNDFGAITNWDAIEPQIKAKIQAAYPDATSEDPKNPNSAFYRFVAYHFLKGKMAYNRFVHHCCEYNYRYGANILEPQEVNYTVDVWDYFSTISMGSDGRRGLIKVLQVPTGEHEIYLNRITKYDNGMQGTYKEVSTRPYTTGHGINIKINATNGEFDNNASNGYYYPIDGILLYDQETRRAIGSERIRFDLTTITPEIISNNFRGIKYQAFQHGYFEDITNETDGTEIYYLMCGWNGTGYWHDYQGDEFLFSGLYDFVLRLPPVPVDGTYEIRMGSALNPSRGMCTIYFGESPDNTLPVGLPFDLRQGTNYNKDTGTFENYEIPYIKDDDLNFDENLIIENDKELRTHGYMKAPAYFWDTTFNSSARDQGYGSLPALRRIITVADMKANKTYYLRFKSSLKKLDSQFFVDYFEIVPANIFNGTEPEDIW